MYIIYPYPLKLLVIKEVGFPGGSMVKNLPANAGDLCSIPGLGRSHGQRMLTGYSSCGCGRVGHEGEAKQQQQRECFYILSVMIKSQHLWIGRETGEAIHMESPR